MNTALAQNGLDELNLSGAAKTDTVGGSTSMVSTACGNLNDYAANLDTFIENLTAQKDAILVGWEGEAADMLREHFPGLIDAFKEIPASIRSIADWATSTMNSYVSEDADAASKISGIMGGGVI